MLKVEVEDIVLNCKKNKSYVTLDVFTADIEPKILLHNSNLLKDVFFFSFEDNFSIIFHIMLFYAWFQKDVPKGPVLT